MPSDLKTYARQHRYRVRNLHDGRPVPPVRPKRKADQPVAFIGPTERDDAIMCKRGYAHIEGDLIGWVLLARSARALGYRLGPMRRIMGVVVDQEGDAEAAGTAPVEALDAVLGVLEPYRRKPASVGGSAEQMDRVRRGMPLHGAPSTAPESTQTARVGG